MADVVMTRGNDFEHPMTLEDDGLPININSSSTLLAALLDVDDVVLITSTAISESTVGSDWSNGKIVVKFTSAQTTINGTPLEARIEVRIETAATQQKTSYFSDFFTVAFSAMV